MTGLPEITMNKHEQVHYATFPRTCLFMVQYCYGPVVLLAFGLLYIKEECVGHVRTLNCLERCAITLSLLHMFVLSCIL